MTPDEAIRIWELVQHYGLPAALGVPTLVFLLLYANRERRRTSDEASPPWVRALRQDLADQVDQRLDALRDDLTEELSDLKRDARARDERQQRIETALAAITATLASRRRGD